MCDIDDPPAGAIVHEVLSDKEAGRLNPDGVRHLDHLWEQLKDIHEPLSVVIRTTDLVIPHPIGAFWSFREAGNGLGESTDLRFDLPDVVCQAIQGHYANQVADRFFGLPRGRRAIELQRAEPYRDGQRKPVFSNHGITRYIEPGDWQMMREVIEATKNSWSGRIGGTSLEVCRLDSNNYGLPALGRVRDNRLQLFLGKGAEADIIAGWQQEFRTAIGL